MAKKPTYEELEQRIEELENEAFELKRVEDTLRESEVKYRTLVEQLPSAIYIAAIDEASTTLFISPQIEEILGFKPDEWKEDHDIWLIQIHPDDRERVLAEVEASHKIGESFLSEYRMTTRDGRTIWIRDQAKIVQDDEGRPLFLQGMMSDITDLKQAQEALRESEEKYRNIFENVQDVYYEATLHGIILKASPSIEEVTRYKSAELIGKSLYDIYIDPGKRDNLVKELLKDGKVTDYEILLKDKNGSQIYCSITAKLVTDKHGNPTKIIGSMRNISERKLAEKALRYSEAQKKAILNASIDRLRYVDKDMKIIWANKTAALGVDMSPEELVGQTCHKVFIDRETPCEECPTVRARETGKIERAVMYQPKFKGMEGESYWDNYSVPLKNDAGEVEGFIQTARNITDKKLAEEHVHVLTQQLMKAQENERQMISYELHDRVGQDLSTLKIGLDTLIDNQPKVVPETKQRVLELSKMLQDSIMIIRDLSYDLHPPSLDQLGLVRTILQYVNDFSEKTGLSVDFTSAGMDELRLNVDTEINMYRLIQEGLNNIRKHAHANNATIRLIASFPDIILRIEDDGEGFDLKNRLVAAQNEKRMGLRSMEERVSLLDGAMRIQSRPGKGTRILIEVPFEEKKSES